MYYHDLQECVEHRFVKERIESIEKDIVNIHSDLQMIKYLLIIVIASILGTGVLL